MQTDEIRLKCLELAKASASHAEQVVANAKLFEEYVNDRAARPKLDEYVKATPSTLHLNKPTTPKKAG